MHMNKDYLLSEGVFDSVVYVFASLSEELPLLFEPRLNPTL